MTSTSADEVREEASTPVETSEDVLVQIPDAIVHLIDEQESPHLATANFTVVRINQEGNAIVVLVRVGEDLQWPLMRDEPTVKLDTTHYFFTLRVPPEVNGENIAGSAGSSKDETLNYGVTFPSGHEAAIQQLDSLLEQYSFFSSPTLVEGNEKNQEIVQQAQDQPTERSTVPPAVELPGEGKEITEDNQADFWTTMAPNVNDYNSSLARGIASGSGQIIRGIFWLRNSTVAQLENGSAYMRRVIKPSDKPSEISPRTLRNLERVRSMSRMTENLVKSVLSGVLRVVGFFSGAVLTSTVGKQLAKLLPGEVVLVSLDAFGKLFDSLEKTGTDIMQSTSLMTQTVISSRYGQAAGQVTQETLATAGHMLGAVWTISKIRKALNPSDAALKA